MYLCNVHNLCFCVIQICKMHHLSSSRHRQQRVWRERKRERGKEREKKTRLPVPHWLRWRVPRPAINAPCEHAQPLCVLCLFFTLFSSSFFAFLESGQSENRNWGYWGVQLTGYGGHTELRYCCCWWLSKIDCQKKKVPAPSIKRLWHCLGG